MILSAYWEGEDGGVMYLNPDEVNEVGLLMAVQMSLRFWSIRGGGSIVADGVRVFRIEEDGTVKLAEWGQP